MFTWIPILPWPEEPVRKEKWKRPWIDQKHRGRIIDFKKNPKTNFKVIDKLSKEGARDEIEALREGIYHHDYLYYVKNQPKISDAVYDKLFLRLQKLEEKFPEFHSNTSPTRRVGAEPVGELKRVAHADPMLSLNAVPEAAKVEDFDDFVRRKLKDDVEYILEPKFDGLSVELVYEGGAFKYGATRGNGEEGEDISANLKTVRTVPLKLRDQKDIPSFLSVRGEVFMPKKGFQEMNRRRIERGDLPFANPRNAAAGTMRQLDSKNVADKPFDIYFYDILQIEGPQFDSHWQALKRFSDWGLKVDPNNQQASSFDKIESFHQKLSEQRDEFDYDIDGIVIKVDRYAQRESLGVRHRSPRWALAWKFPPKKEVTVLEDIVVQVGRTGVLTPVALLQQVDVGGVTVSRATLHNQDEVEKKDVRPGDEVRIERAGDVIPEVVERIKKPGQKRAKPFSMPKNCPVCGSEIVREGAYYLCPAGLSCEAQLVGRIIHYAARDAMDIRGLGVETVKAVVDRGLVKDIADLYQLSVDDILQLEGFAEKSAKNLHSAIQDKKTPRLDRFLYALGIRHVGQRIARILALEYRSLDVLNKVDRQGLEQTAEIGPEIAESVADFFKQAENQKVLERLAEAGVKVQKMPTQKSALRDKTFVFTGSLDSFTRDEAKEKVEMLGGRATSSVSGETDYLVVGENPGSKLDEANKENVEILEEREFKDLIGE
jgi:DNA ligase (NAD+)